MEKKTSKKSNVADKFRDKRGGRNQKRTFAAGEEVKVHKQSHNDASWYMSDQQLCNDVASISFNTALGNPITLRGSLGVTYSTPDFNFSIPGIMSIYTTPTIGVSKDANSPVNIAMRRLYTYVRHANSGHSNYDPADLMIYLLAMDSVYTYWAYMVRAYGVAQVFSRTNKYVGDVLLTAMGIDPSIRENMADFRAFINTFAAKAQQWCVPRVMTYFLRHNWMYSNVYKDEDNDKAQMFMYVPATLYKYNPTSPVTNVGGLEAIMVGIETTNTGTFQVRSMPLRYVDILAIGYQLLNALAAQEDIGIISGDILKAYGAENLWKIDTIPEDYQVIPTYSEEVLLQYHNTAFSGVQYVDKSGNIIGTVAFNIDQDTNVGGGCLLFDPIINNGAHITYDTLMDTWHPTASAEEIMVASRNMLSAQPFTPSTQSKALVRAVQLRSCGSELCLFGCRWKIDPSGVLSKQAMYRTDTETLDAYEMPRFNMAPIRLVTNAAGQATSLYGEITNYGILSKQNVDQIHEVALMSLFGVPYLK